MSTIDSEIKKSLQILKQGGLILYPTDTVWAIGCDASNLEAVKRIYALKRRKPNKTLSCFVADERMLERYVKQIPPAALNIIDVTDKPTTIIYDNAQNLASNLIAKDGSVGIRIPDDDFCYWLTRRFNGAITCTSANVTGQPIPKSFKEIAPSVLKGVDYVVNLQNEKAYSNPPSIIKLSNSGIVEIIRK